MATISHFFGGVRGGLIQRNDRKRWMRTVTTTTTTLSSFRHSFFHPLWSSFSSPLYSPLVRHPSSMSSVCNTTNSSGAHGSSPQPSPTKTVRALIKGRVQGVFYRNWTIENARQLGLKGWVRNRRDGSVEALFSGDPDSVHEMEQRCRRGPPDAVVTGFQVFPSNDDPGQEFQLKPTT
ncbi:hypothetical protein HHK36_018167 [Tetracentron sinense]|uniref:acylphosphatase n=1 Tax=Tetracentron sinense TaxID=13715 RepID=A0A835DA29_TETSI|nr:hypothetical protein HHK36_018167 [Tetracentron sinense]